MNEEADKHRIYLGEINENISPTLIEALEYVKWGKYVNKNTRVFVKPNFTFPYYEPGVTTNPEFLKCLLKVLKSRTDKVIVGECNGSNYSYTAEDAFKGHKMYEICQELGVQLVSLSQLPSRIIKSEICGKKVEVPLPNLLLDDIDCFVTVPVLKVHVMTTVSLSLKNSWGCVPADIRGIHHQNFSHKLSLISKFIKPKLIVVDGTYSLNKHGPMYGEAVKTNLILVSDNTVAADAMGARLLGFDPSKIHYISQAERAGLGSVKLEDVKINQKWEPFQRKFYIKRTFIDILSKIPFNSSILSKLMFDSPLKPLVYKIGGIFKTSKERETSDIVYKRMPKK